jgi:hypothetical protein
MCCVTIDFNEYLLPLAKGLALVSLMQQATKCDSRYGDVGLTRTVWTEAEPVRIELVAVSAGQVKPRPPELDSGD